MNNRKLIERYPDLLNNNEIPVTYHYADLYPHILTDVEGNIISKIPYSEDLTKLINVADYQTAFYIPNIGSYKPISKLFNIKLKNDKQ